MDIEQETLDGCALFRLFGNLEIYATEDLKAGLIEPVREGGFPKVVVDLTHVDFVDSSGLGLLMQMQFKNKDTRFRFCGVKENIRLSMEYTNLSAFFAIDATPEACIEKLRAR
jgi:anti-anti-sigma factor